MTKEQQGQLLYHLTAIENLESIFQHGLQSRAALSGSGFKDVADADILDSRELHGLDKFIPFHYFAKTPFDYGVQRSKPDQRFVLITVRRETAKANNWQIIPQHPLAEEGYQILDYAEGLEAIDWTLIAKRDYEDRACKVACMAECLSPNTVPADRFCSIFVKTQADKDVVDKLVKQYEVSCHINMAAYMFAGNKDV